MSTEKRILIIEDDASIRESLKELLSEEGYQIFEAENGLHGLQVLENLKDSLPALILLDLSMPIMGGMEFLQIQKNDDRWKLIPVAVLTAAGGTSKPHLADDFLRKPLHLDHLFRMVEKWC